MLNFITVDAITPQLQVVKKWMEAYHSLDMTKVEQYTSKDFKYCSPFDRPEEGKEDHSSRYGKILASMKELNTTVLEAIEAPGKVVLHVTTDCTSHHGKVKEKDAVCILSLIEEDGEYKIVDVKEFANPQKNEVWDQHDL